MRLFWRFVLWFVFYIFISWIAHLIFPQYELDEFFHIRSMIIAVVFALDGQFKEMGEARIEFAQVRVVSEDEDDSEIMRED